MKKSIPVTKPALPPAAPMTIEMWPIDRPAPYKKNARTWSGSAIAKVAASIKEFGFRQPLVVDVEGVIVIGHLRQAAARYLGLTEVPVHVAADLSTAQIKALRIADNRTHEEAVWDTKMLGVELIELKIVDFDIDITGFESDEIIASVFGGGKKTSRPAFTDSGSAEFPGGSGLSVPDFEPTSEASQGRLDQKKHICPKCSHEFYDAAA